MKYLFLIIILFILYWDIFCGLCGLNPPQDRSYCGNYLPSDEKTTCLYCKEKASGKYYCLTNDTVYNNTAFECENSIISPNEDLPGAPCSNNEEIKNASPDRIDFDFCKNHTKDEKHPCCYFDDGINKKCFSIGEITSMTLYTYNDFLDCISTYINFRKYWLFIFLIFYL